jgi:hypothetical protein
VRVASGQVGKAKLCGLWVSELVSCSEIAVEVTSRS